LLGWNIGVYRQQGAGAGPARTRSPTGSLVARWQGGLNAVDWLHDLVPTGDAIDLGGNGYPSRMTARAGAVLSVIENGPPEAHERWITESTDILLPHWAGKTVYEREIANACTDEEWLIVEIWDES
jgi:hypothetical protein